MQNLLNALSQSCSMDKVYLFDTYSKLCIAMDSTPNQSGWYEQSCDSIDVVFELVNIYCQSDAPTLGAQLENETNAYPIVSSIMYPPRF